MDFLDDCHESLKEALYAHRRTLFDRVELVYYDTSTYFECDDPSDKPPCAPVPRSAEFARVSLGSREARRFVSTLVGVRSMFLANERGRARGPAARQQYREDYMTKLVSFFPFAAAVFLSTTAFASRSLILTNQTNQDINCVVAFWDTTSHTWVSGPWTRHIPNGGSASFEEQYDIGYYHCEAINQPNLWAGNKDAYFCTPPGESGRMYDADRKAACEAAGRTMLPFGSTGGNSQITLRL